MANEVYIKSDTKIQFFRYSEADASYSKVTDATGDTLKIDYIYYPTAVTALTDTIDSEMYELIRLKVMAMMYESQANARMSNDFRNQYRMAMMDYKKNSMGKTKSGNMLIYTV